MYLIEWGFWRMATESESARKAVDAEMTPAEKRANQDFYEGDLSEEMHFQTVSERPCARGPIFAFNETFMEVRCGGSEEKRGLITLMILGGLGPIIYTGVNMTLSSIYMDFFSSHETSLIDILITLLMTSMDGVIIYFYLKYGLQFTRLEVFTSRHLLIRFNRKTQQVHLHRPSYCGGLVTFPWRTTGSTGINPEDDSLSIGMRLGLIWHPSRTGLPHMEMALLGKQGQGGSELRDEWEFIRRYMEEGPQAVPRPRLSTQLPSPIQAFSAQFEGLGRFFRKSSWLFKAVQVRPAHGLARFRHHRYRTLAQPAAVLAATLAEGDPRSWFARQTSTTRDYPERLPTRNSEAPARQCRPLAAQTRQAPREKAT